MLSRQEAGGSGAAGAAGRALAFPSGGGGVARAAARGGEVGYDEGPQQKEVEDTDILLFFNKFQGIEIVQVALLRFLPLMKKWYRRTGINKTSTS